MAREARQVENAGGEGVERASSWLGEGGGLGYGELRGGSELI